MAITEVQHSSDNSSAAAGDKTPHQDWPVMPAAGNLMVCIIQWAQSKGDATCTMTSPGWTQLPAPDGDVSISGKCRQAVFARIAGTDEPLRVEGRLSASRWWVIHLVEVNSTVTTLGWLADVAAHNSLSTGSTSPTTGTTATTTVANEYWVAGIVCQSAGTLSAPTNGFTIIEQQALGSSDNDRVSGAMLSKIVAATSPASTGGTLSSSRAWIGTIVTFKQANVTVTGGATLSGLGALRASPYYSTGTLAVQAAFGVGPSVSVPDWTIISSYVGSCHWQRGRQNELNTTEAGTASLVIRDPDSAFDSRNSSSPFYPNVKPGTPIRAIMFFHASYFPLFHGFIERIPRTLRVTDKYTERQIDLIDGFAILASAGLGGMSFPQELSDVRVSSVLDNINWPTTARQIGPGSSPLQAVLFDGDDDTRAQAHLQQVSDSENGFLFANGAGHLYFVGRHTLITDPRWTTTQATFIDTPTTTTGPPWYNAAWGYRKPITIDHTKVSSSTQSNFPILISRTDASWKHTGSGGHGGKTNGGDILFTAADGTTKLDHELEKYVSSTGELIAWVRIPSLSNTTDTVIYAYYGNASAADQQNPTGVWDSNYKTVWHLGNGTAIGGDSTTNAHTLTANGNAAPATGMIYGGATLDGSGDFFTSPDSVDWDFGAGDFTIEGWMRFNVTSGVGPLVAQYPSGDAAWSFELNSFVGGLAFVWSTTGANEFFVARTWAPATGTWYHVSVVRAGSALRLFVNGSQLGTDGTLSGTIFNSTAMLSVGSRTSAGGSPLNGLLDEIRISKGIGRTAGWIATSYNTQNSPSTFSSAGSEEAAPVLASRYTNLIPSYDLDNVFNKWTGTRTDGTPQIWEDEASQEDYPLRAKQLQSLVTTDAEVLNQIQWKTGQFSQPLNRIETLEVMPLSDITDTATIEAVIGLEVADRITIIETPPGFGGAQSQDYIIQHLEGELHPGPLVSMKLTYQVWPASTTGFWIAGDDTQSRVGETTRPGY
jgi:Concanavalin A-like lectin/glucanases superfamily/Domain of unknown function (DUF2341)